MAPLSLLFAAVAVVASEPVVYEGFTDYAPGTHIAGQSGGIGFASEWDTEAALNVTGATGGAPAMEYTEVLDTSLSYSDGIRTLETSGGSLWVTGEFGSVNLARIVDPEALPHSGPEPWLGRTTYISFLFHRTGAAADPNDPVYADDYPWGDNLYPRAASLKFSGRDGRQMRFGNLSNLNDNVWRVTGEDLYGTDGRRDPRSTVPFGGETAFVVIRIDHGGGGSRADRFRVWINPDLATEAANGLPMLFDWTVRNDPHHIAPDWISIVVGDGSGNRPHAEVILDEFRLGPTWESVTPHTGGDFQGAYPLLAENEIHTGDRYLGWLRLTQSPSWAWSWTLRGWIHLPEGEARSGGGWIFLPEILAGGIESIAPPEPDGLLAYEGFDYDPAAGANLTSGQLDGGFGWSTPWQTELGAISTRAPVDEGSLGYIDESGRTLQTSGHHAFISGTTPEEAFNPNGYHTFVKRALAESPAAIPDNRVYLSFIAQRTGEAADPDAEIWQDTSIYPNGYPFGDNLYPRGATVQFLRDFDNHNPSAQIGNISNQSDNRWGFFADATEIRDDLPFHEPAFIVVRLDYSGHQMPNLRGEPVDRTGTRATVWVNPRDLSLEDPGDAHRETVLLDGADPFDVEVHAIALSTLDASHNRPVSAMLVDEIRVGTTWASVTPYVGEDPDRVDPTDPAAPTEWLGAEVSRDGYVYAGPRIGTVWVGRAPWIYSHDLGLWFYLPEEHNAGGDAWAYVYDMNL
ncbi:MAG: hypothetical protein JJU00_11230 [Opitutales bacterium]|nr:hypothetical protein [Opitutales bacterium]